MDSNTIPQRALRSYTVGEDAKDEIRRALVLGLFAVTEVERVRNLAECDRLMGQPWPDGTVPVRGMESHVQDIASALLWIETTMPQPAAQEDAR